MLAFTPSVILSAKKKETSLLFTNKDYKGLPARSHRKVQTHCHLRGNFPYLGEERAPMKSTKSLADVTTRPLGIARSSPQTARVQRDALLASFLLASPPPKTLRGVKLAYSTLCTISPRATLSPGGTMQRTATKPGADAMVRRLNATSGKGSSQRQGPTGPMFFCYPTEAEGR